tara:strand:- start:2080 stop:2232 length:153 start_codon:yes stop_codon:yes gene_type:complete
MVTYQKESSPEINTEITEMKQSLRHRNLDDTLSEWELSRQTSKTWSMEQD